MSRTKILAAACLLAASGAIRAQQPDAPTPWEFQLGSHHVDPRNNNGAGVEVGGDTAVTANVRYFLDDRFALDLLAAVPFRHEISLKKGPEVASARQLPPTLSLMWYPLGQTMVRPFLGAGLTYVTFFDEKTRGALAGNRLRLDDSFGPSAMGGLEYTFRPRVSVFVDVRWMDVDTKAKINGGTLGTVHVDPVVYGIAVAYRF